MTSAYIRELNRLLEPERPVSQPKSLKQRFLDWYLSLPEFTRNRAFSMSEFEAAQFQACFNRAVSSSVASERDRHWPALKHLSDHGAKIHLSILSRSQRVQLKLNYARLKHLEGQLRESHRRVNGAMKVVIF